MTTPPFGTVSKAISAALSPLVGGTAKEVSGYLADNIRFLRWKNAVRILQKAKKFCADEQLNKSDIPIKFIVPFLEAASLEEDTKDETISDMWASLFATAVTSYRARHTVYVDTLKKLSSEDARYLSALFKKMMADELYREGDFDPDLWNVNDKQDAITNFQTDFSERGKELLAQSRKGLFFEIDSQAVIKECASGATSRTDLIPLSFDLALFDAEEWINSTSSPFELPAPHLEIVANLCALNILEKFECVAWCPKPHRKGFWALRATVSFAFVTSIGWDFMKTCAAHGVSMKGARSPRQ